MAGAKRREKGGTEAKVPTFAEQTAAIDEASGPMAIRLLSQREGERLVVRATGPTLLVPVHAGIAEIECGHERSLVDGASFFHVPAGSRATVTGKSPTTHTLVLVVAPELRATIVATYEGEIDPKKFEAFIDQVHVLPRTNWVNELCHRYLFERAVCHKRGNVATTFLEMEITKELYFLCRARVEEGERTSVAEAGSSLVERAIAVIEANLFDADVVARISKRSGASASTLLRAFKREVGCGPLAYVRRRRLDESMMLLKSKRYSVGEIATLVGYKNFAAFSQAFRTRFGMRPSDVRVT